ncbi:MAG TPA: ribosome maturation factor RimM [Anaerolineales bacterium]|nr:ribosome maturation factor RimM [Anaerolineales bacterium]
MSPAPRRTTERARRPSHLVVGRVVRPHGVRGDLLVESLSQVLDTIAPEATIYFGKGRRHERLRSIQRHGDHVRIHIEGCDDRARAEAYRGEELLIRLDDAPPLPEGRYYHWEILGLRVVSEQGETLGRIRRILETGANDVYVVDLDDGDEILLPAINSVVQGVDLEQGVMHVRLLAGLVETTRRKASGR